MMASLDVVVVAGGTTKQRHNAASNAPCVKAISDVSISLFDTHVNGGLLIPLRSKIAINNVFSGLLLQLLSFV